MQFCKFDQKSYICICIIWRLYLYALVLPFLEPNWRFSPFLILCGGREENMTMMACSELLRRRHPELNLPKRKTHKSLPQFVEYLKLCFLFYSCQFGSHVQLKCGIGCFKKWSFFREQQRYTSITKQIYVWVLGKTNQPYSMKWDSVVSYFDDDSSP